MRGTPAEAGAVVSGDRLAGLEPLLSRSAGIPIRYFLRREAVTVATLGTLHANIGSAVLRIRYWNDSDSNVVFTTGSGMAMVCRGTANIRRNTIKVFVICDADGIERSSAKAFRLSRINEAGESRPFSIVVIRTHANDYFGYVNSCPHQGIWLNFGRGISSRRIGRFSNAAGTVRCSRSTPVCASRDPARTRALSRLRSPWSTAKSASAASNWKKADFRIRSMRVMIPWKS